MSTEHRKFPRVGDNTRVVCKPIGDDGPDSGDDGFATNISGGGICFVASEPYQVGQRLALEMELPGFPSGIIAIARVAWCEAAGSGKGGHEIGAEFHWVGWESRSAQEQIASYIRDKLGS